MSRPRRLIALALIWTAPSAILLVLAAVVYGRFRIDVPDRLGDDARAAIVATVRAALDGGAATAPDHPELQRSLPDGGPVAASFFLDGRMIGRVEGFGPTIAAATSAAAGLIAKHEALTKLDAEQRQAARVKVDVVVGRGRLVRDHPLLALVALNPGLDGLGVTLGEGDQHLLMPDELITSALLTKDRPFKLTPELAIGLNFVAAEAKLADRAGRKLVDYQAAPRTYWRFRTDSFVERPLAARPAAPLPLVRGVPPGPALSADALRTAALDGGRFLVAHLGKNGRYMYETSLITGKSTDPDKPGPYSIPRHAGVTYFLAELYRHTKEEFLREPIERAFAHLQELLDMGGCKGTGADGVEYACVADRGEKRAGLGSTALTVVALAEYQRATGDTRYQALAEKLAAWILRMQRPDGSFRHMYEIATNTPSEAEQLLYYSGEAALALARMHVITGEARYAQAAERGLDWLVGWYDFFLGSFLYGEEHWTCIAAQALWPTVQKSSYVDFCTGYGAFLRQQQPAPGDFPDQGDLVGSYSVTPFVMPFNTPAGSRSEAMISSYLLSRDAGVPDEALRQQVLATLTYLLRQQVRPDSDYAIPTRALPLGAVSGSPIDRNVRIDYVQHVCSAMIRGIELLEPPH